MARNFAACLVLVLLPILTGCQTSHTLDAASFDYSQELLPEVYVTVQGDVPEHYVRNLIRAKGVFSQVKAGKAFGEGYTLKIDARKSSDDLKNQSLIVLGALTMFILPVPQEQDSRLSFQLFKGEKLVKSYEYSNYSRYYVSLFHINSADIERHENLGRIMSRFVSEIQSEGVMR